MLKINAPIRGYAEGAQIEIKTDKDGTPLDRYWRDRIKDAAIDGCVEFVDAKKSKTKKGDS